MSTFVFMSDLARRLGTTRSSLVYHVQKGSFAGPTHWVGNRRAYTQDEADAIAGWWAERIPYGVSRHTQAEVDLMRYLWERGMPQGDIAHLMGTTQTVVSSLLTGRTLPGWRGGKTGRGRRQLPRHVRRRNRKAVGSPVPAG